MNVHRNSLVAAAAATALLAPHAWADGANADATAVATAANTSGAATAASTSTDSQSESLQAVIVTGTRESGIKALDSPAPVQVISSDALSQASSTPDLISTLAEIVPSLTTTTFGGDLSNTQLQAALRNLSPNDTLVLVNGKRRHTTANIDVGDEDSSFAAFAGGAGVDLNFIPADAIDHIEVLTDGAAAQYGSDAIAGVVNIILKKAPSGGNLQASYGGYQDGGGKTDDVTGNIGFEPYDGAYINFTGEFRNHGHTDRDAALDYTQPSAFETGANGQLTPIPGLYPFASGASTGLQPIDANSLNAPGQPALNKIEGDAQYQIKLTEFDSGFKIDDNAEFYAFGTFGQKAASSIENYRLPDVAAYNPALAAAGDTYASAAGSAAYGDQTPESNWVYQYPYGFTPLEDTQETDYNLTAGIRGTLVGWNWDLSTGYGRDYIDFYTDDSTNPVLYFNSGNSPTSFYDGSFKSTQSVTNLDLDHEYDVGLAGPLNVALGAEQRRDSYAIGEGSPASYGESAWDAGGAAAFQGFGPYDQGIYSRTNSAGYVDFAAKVIGGLRLDIAGRYEDYSDFGAARSGKFTARYDFSSAFALRGTISNGFRAPTVAEEYYAKSATSPSSASVQFGADSAAAALYGLGKLQPETSVNYSFGAVYTPVPQFAASLDLYLINLDHRITLTNAFNATQQNAAGVYVPTDIYNLVWGSIGTNGNTINPTLPVSTEFFTNGFDTQTEGADLVLDYITDFNSFGRVDWSLRGNYDKTTISAVRGNPASLPADDPVESEVSLSGIANTPKYTLNFGGLWTYDKLSVNLREVIHGSYEYLESPFFDVNSIYTAHIGAIPITNLDISYDVLESVRLSIGAVNLFNRYPEKDPLAPIYNEAGFSFGAAQYLSSPIGFDGGYYYVKATYSF